jgi:membrane-associated phospholipid phosphatase
MQMGRPGPKSAIITGMHELVILLAKYVVVVPVIALAVVFWRLDKRLRLEMAVFLALSVILATVLAKLAATLHQDPRPFVHDGVTPYFAHGPDNGFPSDHTTYSAVIAFVVLRYSRKLGAALAVLALLIGSARVIAGVHHGQDIIAGLAIAAIGTGLALVFTKGLRRHYPKLLPKPTATDEDK